jgi:uncharacterized protein (TIGR02444 family)
MGQADGFWDFSIAIYGAPKVAPTLLRLQDESNADVNLVLYVLWRAAAGRQVSDAGCLFMERETAHWRENVVRPLRAVRQAMKQLSMNSPQSEALRNAVKNNELEAERLQQLFLQTHLADITEVPNASLSAAIHAGLGIYAAHLRSAFSLADLAILTEAVAAWTRDSIA